MKRILITGANGFIGRYLLKYLSRNGNYEVIGTSKNDDIQPQDGFTFIKSDLCNKTEVEYLFFKVKPDIVVNTAALSSIDVCEDYPEKAYSINVEAVKSIMANCKKYNSFLIHISTDFVFDGSSNILYTEYDIPAPINQYGKNKYESEKLVLAESDIQSSIVRVVVVYGKPLESQHGNIVTLVANRLTSNTTINVVNDQWRTPTYVGDVATGIHSLIENPQRGIFHLAGPECMTIAEIAFQVADVLKLDQSLIHPVTTKELKERVARPIFSGLSIKETSLKLNYHPHCLKEAIQLIFQDKV